MQVLEVSDGIPARGGSGGEGTEQSGVFTQQPSMTEDLPRCIYFRDDTRASRFADPCGSLWVLHFSLMHWQMFGCDGSGSVKGRNGNQSMPLAGRDRSREMKTQTQSRPRRSGRGGGEGVALCRQANNWQRHPLAPMPRQRIQRWLNLLSIW